MRFKFIKDILFPVFCVECGKENFFWCEACIVKHQFSLISRCPGCNTNNAGELCGNCRPYFYIDYSFAFFEYRENDPAAKLIRDFKYNFAHDVAEVWEMMINKAIGKMPLPDGATIVPVPLFARRERERGYNQAGIIAKIIFNQIKKYFPERKYFLDDQILARSRQTAQQAKLSKTDREKNVQGAFAVKNDKLPETIMLVDDVFTTGATLNECAHALKTAGVKTIYAVTLARAI
jgi:ComF family protein